MSEQDQNNNSGDNTPETNNDPLLNLKSEISRKLQNSESRMSELMKQNQAMAESLKSIASRVAPPPAPKEEEDLESLAYSNPTLYAKKIAQMATKSATEATMQVQQEQAQKTMVLNSLYKDYPELSNTDSELTKTAVEIYNNLTPSEQASPSSYKLAVREAAAQLGVLPSSKRAKTDDDFVAPGSRGNSGSRSERSASKKDEIDPAVLEISKLFGRDVNDPKVRERLKQHSKRTKWNRYE